MSGTVDKNEILAAERAINEQYRIRATRWLEETHEIIAKTTSLAQNSIWTTGAAKGGLPKKILDSLVGRVAFDSPASSPVEGELYVGPYPFQMDGVMVVSWASEVGKLHYHGRAADDRSAPHVTARRTFVTEGGNITDFADDVEPNAPEEPFAKGRPQRLEIPQAPRQFRPQIRQSHQQKLENATEPSHQPIDAAEVLSASSKSEPKQVAAPPKKNLIIRGLARAESLVLRAIERPRTGRLSSVLSTLQPDQHRLVTWPADQPLIVSGHPGTGKTVIAMHRAGYLTHPDRREGPLNRVVVVGPTDDYRRHVDSVSQSIGGAHVPVVGLPGLLGKLASIDISKMSLGVPDRLGATWELRSIVQRTAKHVRQKGVKRQDLFDEVLETLITKNVLQLNITDRYPEISEWLLAIGNRRTAISHVKYLPLLAAIGMATRDYRQYKVQHLIVDEAQDIPPLVWLLLVDLLEDGASISIFGDMNQRRSDWTSATWQDLAQDLELTNEDGTVDIQYLETGYRTTQEIMSFANRLLPVSERKNNALRVGVPPVCTKVVKSELFKASRLAAEDLGGKYKDGLTAIITNQLAEINNEFRKNGWTRSKTLHDGWTRQNQTIYVLHPDSARGLEFDAVIVVEPSSFPRNMGRFGVLYTSLTRATQELCVVFSKAEPRDLRLGKSSY